MTRQPDTINALLERAAGFPDTGLRILDRDEQPSWFPWPVVFERACRAAAWLQDAGVRASDRVGLVFPTEIGFFDAFFGVLLAGAVPVPLYPPVRLGRLDDFHAGTTRMLRAVEARLLVADRRTYRLLGEVARDANPALGCRALEHLPDTLATPAVARPDDLALVQFSSGTTVDPKPVALTHRAVVAQATILNSFWPDTGSERHSGVSWLPLYHDMGLIGCVMTAIERPGTITLVPPELFVARPAVWLRAISRYRASVSPAPNFAYNLATHRISDEDLEGVDLSSWRFALCGAETVVADVARAFQSRFRRWGFAAEALTPVYGMSEAALAVTFGDPARPFVSRRFDRDGLVRDGVAREAEDGREIVSVGRPVPGFDVRIRGDDGEMLPEGGIGVIECCGPSLMQGYLNRPDATADALRDGWLVTGDLGFVWRGELFLTGRRKDMLIINGANHAPEDVELAVQHVDGVRTGCVVAASWLPEGADGERLMVFVEARRDVAPSQFDTIAGDCAGSIVAATGLSPHQVIVLRPGTLPRTSSGKLRRGKTLAQHLAGQLAPPSPTTPLRLAAALARSAVAHAQAKLKG